MITDLYSPLIALSLEAEVHQPGIENNCHAKQQKSASAPVPMERVRRTLTGIQDM
jgi:hypothetical protein